MTLSTLLRELQHSGLMGSKQKTLLESLHSGRILSVPPRNSRPASTPAFCSSARGLPGPSRIISPSSETSPLSALCPWAHWRRLCTASSRRRPVAGRRRPPPRSFFDYALLFGCILYSIDIAYIETNYHPLGDLWTSHLLVSAIFFFALAYPLRQPDGPVAGPVHARGLVGIPACPL